MEVKDDDRLDYDQDHWFVQLGADFPLLAGGSGSQLILSVMGHAGTSDIKVDDETGQQISKASLRAYGGGLSLTWYEAADGQAGHGLYLDGVAIANSFDYSLSTTAEGHKADTDG